MSKNNISISRITYSKMTTKRKISIFLALDGQVYSNIEISQMRLVPISPIIGGYFVCINKENSPVRTAFVFLCLSSAADAVQILMIKNENAYKTKDYLP